MAVISKIRLANVIYEQGKKRYNDEVFSFDGQNGAILLENGGGKTVLIQTVLQTVLPHQTMSGRKICDSLILDHAPAHIAIEWILQERPRKYGLTAVSLFLKNQELHSHKYVYSYQEGDLHDLEKLPFTIGEKQGKRAASAGEIADYYKDMEQERHHAHYFVSKTEYQTYLAEEFQLFREEFLSLAKINNEEGGIAQFFEDCKTTKDLVYRLLVPTVLLFLEKKQGAGFSDLYAKKRDNLRKYRQLKEELRQNRRIEAKMGELLQFYAKVNEVAEQSSQLKGTLKTYYEISGEQRQQVEAEIAAQSRQEEQARERIQVLDEKMASLKIALNHKLLDKIALKAEEEQKMLLVLQQQWDQMERALEELRYLEKRKEQESLQSKVVELERDLSEYQERYSNQQLEAELQEIHEKMHWIYQEKEQSLAEQVEVWQEKKKGWKEKRHIFYQHKDRVSKQEQYYRQQVAAYQKTIEHHEKEQEKIEREILSNYQEQNLALEQKKWEQDLTIYAVKIAEAVRQKHEKECLWQEKKQQAVSLGEESHLLAMRLQEVRSWLERQQKEEKEVLAQLVALSALRGIVSGYDDRQKIEDMFVILGNRYEQEKEKALQEERQKTRLADDYGDLDFFVMNPVIVSLFTHNNLVVESGTSYLARLIREGYGSKEQLLQQFPLWPFCLVVQPDDKALVLDWLGKKRMSLMTPVFVLTPEELEQGWQSATAQTVVQPDFWQYIFTPEMFSDWKEQLYVLAAEAGQKRLEKEAALESLCMSRHAFYHWQEQYPEEQHTAYLAEEQKGRSRLQFLAERIKMTEKEAVQAEEAMRSAEEQKNNFTQLSDLLEYKMKKAREWLGWQKEKNRTKELLFEQEEKVEACEKKQLFFKSEARRLEKEEEEIERDLRAAVVRWETFRQESLFRALQAYPLRKTEENETVLKGRRDALKARLLQFSDKKSILEERLQEAQCALQEVLMDLAAFSFQLEPEQRLPEDGLYRMRCMQKEKAEKREMLRKQEQKSRAATEQENLHRGMMQAQREQFMKKFNREPMLLGGDLLLLEKELQIEQESLHEECKAFKAKIVVLEKQKVFWSSLLVDMEKEDKVFHYLSNPESFLLSPEKIRDFIYQAEKIFLADLTELKTAEQIRQATEEEAFRRKEAFIHFYESEQKIHEKLKRSLAQGLREKKTYSEIFVWHENISIGIRKVNALAEETIQKQNEDLQHLINQIHLYLRHICDEIKLLEKKTEVRWEEGSRAIYELKTPEWEETVAKEKLLQYFDRIECGFDSDDYQTEDGVEDASKIRKKLEEYFLPVQLFGVVCPEKSFSVGVRKITNQKKVLDFPMDWASSNRWSAGEKWSKNMALFLGIQKYLAEKISPADVGVSRTRMVILDNPFGQASSDHVLEPVFFIAKRLDFQVITLTALASGAFIRNYFPVVYSCRLRPCGNTAVMSKEQEIQEAFFADKEPVYLSRLREDKRIIPLVR